MDEIEDTYLPPPGQADVVAALRAGDERAFAALVEEYGPTMLRVAQMHVSSRAVAEEVVQEAWLGVLVGDRSLRRPLVTQDVDLPDPHEPGEDARRARGPQPAVLVPRGTRRRKRRARRSTPTGSSAADAGTATGRRLRPAGRSCPENAARRQGDDRDSSGSDRCAPRDPAHGDHDARHRGLELRGRS